jgi:hypothetical protein
MARSKFVLCPSGVGWDSFRIWEALSIGSIPIIEHYNRTDGWHRTLNNLPVLWVDHMETLTRSDLEAFLEEVGKKKYALEKLTRQWWIRFVHTIATPNATTQDSM